MSAQGEPYQWTFLLALDFFFAMIVFAKFGLTISTMTWMVEEKKDAPLKLWMWQRSWLSWLGPRLDKIQPNHRKLARMNDLYRAAAVVGWLT